MGSFSWTSMIFNVLKHPDWVYSYAQELANIDDPIFNIVRRSDPQPVPLKLNPATYGLNVETANGTDRMLEICGVSSSAYPEVAQTFVRADRYPRADDTPVHWSLPGHGGSNRPTCGHLRSVAVCPNGHAVKPVRWFCDSPKCADCFPAWARSKGARAVQKLDGAGRLYLMPYVPSMKICHVVISSPSENIGNYSTVGGMNWEFENYARLINRLGLHGVGVLHLWRSPENIDKIPEDQRIPWRLGAHMHVVGYCNPDFIKAHSSEIYKSSGYVVKVIAEDLNLIGAQCVVTYALSHCAIGSRDGSDRTIQALRYYGALSNSKLRRVGVIVEKQPLTCSNCGAHVHDFEDLTDFNAMTGGHLDDVIDEVPPVKRRLEHQVYTLPSKFERYRDLMTLDDEQIYSVCNRYRYELAISFDRAPVVLEQNCDFEDDNGCPDDWLISAKRGQYSIISAENFEL